MPFFQMEKRRRQMETPLFQMEKFLRQMEMRLLQMEKSFFQMEKRLRQMEKQLQQMEKWHFQTEKPLRHREKGHCGGRTGGAHAPSRVVASALAGNIGRAKRVRRGRRTRQPRAAVLPCDETVFGARPKTVAGMGALPGQVPVGGRAPAPAKGSLGWTNGATALKIPKGFHQSARR